MISAGMTALLASLSETEADALADAPLPSRQEQVSLDGVWLFRPDPDEKGESAGWATPDASSSGWRQVRVPHTWQTEPKLADFRGFGWYRRGFDADRKSTRLNSSHQIISYAVFCLKKKKKKNHKRIK